MAHLEPIAQSAQMLETISQSNQEFPFIHTNIVYGDKSPRLSVKEATSSFMSVVKMIICKIKPITPIQSKPKASSLRCLGGSFYLPL